MQDVPLTVLTATLLIYWIGVGVMIVRVRRALRRRPDADTQRRFERFNLMWVVWVTLVAAWIGIPWATLAHLDIGVATRAPLITDGFFAYIRHPIYAFSMLLMLCSVAIVPTTPMLAVAAIHIVMMNAKARSEERHLLAVHGDAYARYLRTSGRFLPRHRSPIV